MKYQKKSKPCSSCRRPKQREGPLCHRCWQQSIKKPRPERPRLTWEQLFGPDDDPGPSQQEIERTIAEQSQRLPSWWPTQGSNADEESTSKDDDRPPGIRVFHVRAGVFAAKRQPYLW